MNGIVGPNVAVWFHLGAAGSHWLLSPSREDTLCLSLLLALRSGVEDLIYLSQGLRDHPARLLYQIIPPLCSSSRGEGRKRRCNMQLHTCQTLRLIVPEEWSTEGNVLKCIFESWPTWTKISFFFFSFFFFHHRILRILLFEPSSDESFILLYTNV